MTQPTTHRVRTTINPEEELEVSDQELRELRVQGLLLDTKATTPAGARKAAEKQTNQEA